MIRLKDGEIICDKCDGQGDLGLNYKTMEENDIKFPIQLNIIECNKCYGSGKLDWVEAVVGKSYDRRG